MKSSRTYFRANESAAAGREDAIYKYRVNLDKAEHVREVEPFIERMIKRYGPVVSGYPSWHPFTFSSSDSEMESRPQIVGLDHTICFRDAFITAPYGGVSTVTESASQRQLLAEPIKDIVLYAENAKPILVTFEDPIPKEKDGTIAKRYALGRMLMAEVPAWTTAQCGESWHDMRPHVLGSPCGGRSSLFVNQETGQALREVFEMLNRHELFGPVRSR